jgi:hypothetical protein
MIELNSKTQQDFLNREWVQKLLDAGVDMSDAKYCIGRTFRGDYVAYKAGAYNETLQDIIPTYTVSELLYKLREKQGIYTIFNNLRNNDIDNIPIIESLASLLIQCHQKDIGLATKDTGSINDK